MFTLDDLIIDRILMATAEDSNGALLYTLTQLTDATIEITAESREARDARGSLVKRFYNAKSGTFSATNAMLNLNLLASSSGNDKQVAGAGALAIQMPRILVVKQGTATVDLLADGETLIAGSVRVNALGNNGALGKAYELGTGSASATEFIITGDVLTLPTDTTVDKFVVKYERKTENGVKIVNSSNQFPGTVKLTLQALAIDPCTPDVVREVYIIIPSFQVSPEVSITVNSEGTLDYSGDLQVNYCSGDQELYSIVMCGDDEYDED